MPDVAEGIDYCARAVAVEFVLQGFLDAPTGRNRSVEDGIHIFDVQYELQYRGLRQLRAFFSRRATNLWCSAASAPWKDSSVQSSSISCIRVHRNGTAIPQNSWGAFKLECLAHIVLCI